MNTNKKTMMVLFVLLVLFNTQFGYANSEAQSVQLYLKNIIRVSESDNQYKIVFKVTNTDPLAVIRVKNFYSNRVNIDSSDISNCIDLRPGKSCQPSMIISPKEKELDNKIPIHMHCSIITEKQEDSSFIYLDLNTSSDKAIATSSADINFTTSYPVITLRNISNYPIKITKLSLESEVATTSYDESSSLLKPNDSFNVTLSLNWKDWFSLRDNSLDDYMVIDYEDIFGNAKKVFIPINTFIKGNRFLGTVIGIGGIGAISYFGGISYVHNNIAPNHSPNPSSTDVKDTKKKESTPSPKPSNPDSHPPLHSSLSVPFTSSSGVTIAPIDPTVGVFAIPSLVITDSDVSPPDYSSIPSLTSSTISYISNSSVSSSISDSSIPAANSSSASSISSIHSLTSSSTSSYTSSSTVSSDSTSSSSVSNTVDSGDDHQPPMNLALLLNDGYIKADKDKEKEKDEADDWDFVDRPN